MEPDAVDVAVMWDRLVSITDEGATALIRTSFSTLVREGYDLSVFIFDVSGQMIAQSTKCIPVFIGTASVTLAAMLRKFPPDSLRPDDVVISNDPTIGTGHMFDIAVMRPVFHGGRLVGFAMSVTHLPDIGGMGFSAAATEIFHEGLRLPIAKLVAAGALNKDLLDLIALNVRVPEQVIGDIHANLSCVAVVARQLAEFMDEYEMDTLQPLAAAILGQSEAAVRRVLADLPDGRYDSELKVEALDDHRILRCQVEKRGETLSCDFAGTGPCVGAGINVPFPYTRAMALYAVKCVTTPAIPNNDGATAPVTISAPAGSILSAEPPTPSAGRHVIGHFVVPLVNAALASIVPDRVSAASGLMDILTLQGRHANGRPMAATYFAAGGFGGMDGQDGRQTLPGSSNMGTLPVELFEPLSGLTVEAKALRPDSGGAGTFCGGAGQTIVLRNDTGHEVIVLPMANRTEFPPEGMFGGGPGALRQHFIDDRPTNGQGRHILPRDGRLILHQAGGGGFGDPKQRPVESVEKDVCRGFLTEAGARHSYPQYKRSN